jgi:hypothetical protein
MDRTVRTSRPRVTVIGLVVAVLATLVAPATATAAPEPPGTGTGVATAATLGAPGSARLSPATAGTRSVAPPVVRDLTAACPSDRVPGTVFADVAGSVFVPAIACVRWYGLTQGRTATAFDPGGTVTRRQMAVFLYRLLDRADIPLPQAAGTGFRDVPASGPGTREIAALASDDLAGLLGRRVAGGYPDGTFRPAEAVSRAQMAAFVSRAVEGIATRYAAELTSGSCDGVFPDADAIPPPHRASVDRLCALGIVTGRDDGRFAPTDDVTRGQMAAFLARALDVLVEADLVALPDRVATVRVASDCDEAGDGSAERPYCTVGEAVASAPGEADRLDVLLAPGTYTEDLVLDAPPATTVVVAGAGPEETEIVGTHRVTGDASTVVSVEGATLSAQTGTIVDVRSTGSTFLFDVDVVGGTTAVRVADGYTAIDTSVISRPSRVGVEVAAGATGDVLSTVVDGTPVGVRIAEGGGGFLVATVLFRLPIGAVLPLGAAEDEVRVEDGTFVQGTGTRAYVVDRTGNGARLPELRDAAGLVFDPPAVLTDVEFDGGLHPALVPRN